MNLATTFNYFANSLWQVPLLAGCCWCALRLARASAQMQYVVSIAALLLCIALPLRGARPQPDAMVRVMQSDAVFAGQFLHPLPPRPLPFYAVRIRPATRDLLAGLYLALTAFFTLRLLLSHLSLSSLLNRSQAVPRNARLRVEDAALIRLLPEGHQTPMVAGISRPQVLLPSALLHANSDTLQAVLAHEFAHIQRHDTRANLLLRIVSCPIAYHPATALLHRQIQHARELLCDAIAADALGSRRTYAQVLLSLAQELVLPSASARNASVGLFARTSKPLLEERIMNLINPPAPLRIAPRALRLCAAAAVIAAAVSAATLVHLTPAVLAAERLQQAGSTAAATPPLAPATQEPAGASAAKKVTPKPARKEEPSELRQQGPVTVQMEAENAELRKATEGLRAELNSPDFKRQIAEAKAEALRASHQSEESRKQMEAIRKQLASPEFQQQIAQAKAAAAQLTADTPRLVAELKAQALPAQTQTTHAARVSGGVMAGQILTKVAPVYPPDAKAAGVQGAVVMHAIIGKDGTITSLEAISGPTQLRDSALDAVRQWVYKPYLLNGEPTEVETTITVNYSMN